MAYRSLLLQTLESMHGNSESPNIFIDMASTYTSLSIANAISMNVVFVLIKLILEHLKPRSIGCKQDPAEGDFRKDSNHHS